MRDQIVVNRYAKAYVSIVSKLQHPEKVFEELNELIGGILFEKSVVDYFSNPSISIKDKLSAVKVLTGNLKLESVNKKFMTVVVKNNRFVLLKYMSPAIKKQLLASLGMIEVSLTVPSELSSDMKLKFVNAFEKKTGKKVILNVKVDNTIVGGAVAQMGSLLIDGSLKNRLIKIKEKLSEEI